MDLIIYKKLLSIFINFYFLIANNKIEILKIKDLKEKYDKPSLQIYNYSKIQKFKLEKRILLEFISKSVGQNISHVRQIFFTQPPHFGNQMIFIYKVIFFCQILRCKKIIMDKNKFWFIKNTIKDKKYRIKIEVDEEKNIKYFNTLYDNTSNFFYYSKYIKPEFRVDLLRGEILKNLPKISSSIEDLYIYIRSGDIFVKPHKLYIQPPLCFYMKVLNHFEFRKIHLIAQNKNNPVINKLLKNFPFIIYKTNQIQVDIAQLLNAYNLVGGGTSTFFNQILLLNNKLHVLWTFQVHKEQPSKLLLKYNVKNFYDNIKNFVMYATKNYILIMKPWKNTKLQKDFMLNYNCTNSFVLNNYQFT